MRLCRGQVAPWSKTGGLGDVCSSLPISLASRGHRVMVVSPRYKPYEGPTDTGVSEKRTSNGYSGEVFRLCCEQNSAGRTHVVTVGFDFHRSIAMPLALYTLESLLTSFMHVVLVGEEANWVR